MLLQVHKEPVGRRVSAQLHAMITADHSAVTQGPVATAVTAAVVQPGEVSGRFLIKTSVSFTPAFERGLQIDVTRVLVLENEQGNGMCSCRSQ